MSELCVTYQGYRYNVQLRQSNQKLFDDAAKSESAISRLLNPTADGVGSRVYPARNAKNDAKHGIRVDKGEAVHGQPNEVRLHLQINSNAESKTLRDLVKKDSHRVVSTTDVDTQQGATKESLEDLEAQFTKNLKL